MTDQTIKSAAKAAWDADRKTMARDYPDWDMPSWTRAPTWMLRPYILDAEAKVCRQAKDA